MRISIDTGGTFIDVILEDDQGALRLYKSPPTHGDLLRGLLDGIRLAAKDLKLSTRELLSEVELIIHGTTIATNATLTGTTATTAFLTTAGHPDVLVLREGGRLGLPVFDYSIAYPEPYVPRALTYEVPERVTAEGEIERALDETAIEVIIDKLRQQDVEAVGVCLLWAIVNPVHELRVGELLADGLPQVSVTLSHQINPSLREYRRASSTCIDASLKPLMGRYLQDLEQGLRDAGFCGRLLVVTSQGGMMEAQSLGKRPLHSLMSGPAMAPVAGRHYAQMDAQADTAIIADTGGTTYDLSVIRQGRIPRTRESWLGRPYLGHMTGFPAVDVRSVGAGGGSIASVDAAGLLQVGPESAGSQPGPACYGRGGSRATVTDAALALGYIDPGYFLGGSMQLDTQSANEALLRDVGTPLRLDLHQCAAAVLAVMTENMIAAIEEVTVNQGIDPRDALLVGGGGAAGLNAVRIARRLGCAKVIIPDIGAALSAAGGHLSDLGTEFARLHVTSCSRFDYAGVNRTLAVLLDQCAQFVAQTGLPVVEQRTEFFVEARYAEQIWEIEVPLSTREFSAQTEVDELAEAFHRTHRDLFAIEDRDSEIELIQWHARVRCSLRRQPIGTLADAGTAYDAEPVARPVYFDEIGIVDTPILRAAQLRNLEFSRGPVIVESPFTTVVVDPEATVRLSDSDSLLVSP